MPKSAPPLLDVLEYASGSWRARRAGLDGILKLSEELQTSFVFLPSKTFLDDEDVRATLSACYAIPCVFWSPLCQRSNGFFGCENIYDLQGRLSGHITWFRLIVKRVDPLQSTYYWAEMSFYTKWTPDSALYLCFDVPKVSQMRLHQTLLTRQPPPYYGDIYAGHAVILDEVVAMYDESVWALRDGVRQIEKGRAESSRLKTDYPFLHDFARHVVHSTETLGVALDTVSRMIEQQDVLQDNANLDPYHHIKPSSQSRQYLNFQRQLLGSLRARSEANQLRLQNEINFAFNIAAQSQSETLLSINQGTKDDGAAMRAVALVTLTFLPATFVSALFSMTFFNFSPASESRSEAWVVSDKFWIYWSVTIPLTVLTMASWFMWRYWQRKNIGTR